MATYIKVGRIFGIEIDFHWISIVFLLLFLLISVYSFFLLLLLVASVLLHELSHSVTSLRNGIKVRKIILILPIGGLSVIDSTRISAEDEFKISFAGPLTSLLIGSVFGILVVLTPPGIITQICQFVFESNILLGVLNLLPAFPTDGGRIFRSYLERRMNSFKATMLTVKTSKVIILLLLLATVAYAYMIKATFEYKETLFIIMFFTVFFLYEGANAEQELTLLRKDSQGLVAGDVASRNFIFTKPDLSLKELYGIVRSKRTHMLITKIGSSYILINLFDKKKVRSAKSIKDLAMPIPSVSLNENVVDVLSTMESNDSSIVVVVSKDKLRGVLTYQHLQAFIALHVLHQKSGKEKKT